MSLQNEMMSMAALVDVLSQTAKPVLLLEGIRALPSSDRAAVVSLGRVLAEIMPGVVFRSGNADGTDTAFAEGVTSVDPTRMEYVVTHAGMGRKRRHPGARVVALDELVGVAVGPVGSWTIQATPDLKGLVEAYRVRGNTGPVGAKAAYLLRDTLKVTGAPEAGLTPATAGVFYVNEQAPLAGGTGHTIRVCRKLGVPVAFQMEWQGWIKQTDG